MENATENVDWEGCMHAIRMRLSNGSVIDPYRYARTCSTRIPCVMLQVDLNDDSVRLYGCGER